MKFFSAEMTIPEVLNPAFIILPKSIFVRNGREKTKFYSSRKRKLRKYSIPSQFMGRCLITCHGYSGYPEEMNPMGEFFKSRGYDWINLVLPGHNTDPEDLKGVIWKQWTDYVDSQVMTACEKYDEVFFSGLSLGGAMALYVMEHHPSVTAAVALAPPWEVLNWYERILIRLKFLNFWIQRSESDIADIRNSSARPLHRAYLRIHTKSVRQLHDFVKYVRVNLHKISGPILVVHSTDDRVLPFSNTKKIMERISSSDKRLLRVENSGHVLTRDNDTELIYSTALEFMEQYSTSTHQLDQ